MRLPHIELRLATRLLLWFLAISLIPCGVLTALIESITSAALEKTVRRGLMVISETKSAAIESFVANRRGDVTLAGHLPFVIDAVTALDPIVERDGLDSAAYKRESVVHRRGSWRMYRDTYGYSNAFLFDVDGNLLLRLADGLELGTNLKQGPLKDTELGEVFDRSKLLLQSVFSDFQMYPGMNEPLAFVANPIYSAKGVHIGVIVLQLGNQAIFQILNNVNGLGATGETVVGLLKGNEVTVPVPTRFDPSAAFRLKTRLGSAEMVALQRASQGERGFGVTESRGRKVVAAWSYIPSLRWGMVVKQDASEAYELVNRQRIAIGVLFLVTLALVAVVARAVALSLTRPILFLVDAANRVAGGDLTVTFEHAAKGEAGAT